MENRQTPPFLLGGNDFKVLLFTTCSEVACCWMACSHTSFVLTHPPLFLHQTVEHLHMVVDLFGHLSAFFFFDNWRGHGLYFLWHAVKYFLALLSFEVNHIKAHFSLLYLQWAGQHRLFLVKKSKLSDSHSIELWHRFGRLLCLAGLVASRVSLVAKTNAVFFRFPGDSTQIQGGYFL